MCHHNHMLRKGGEMRGMCKVYTSQMEFPEKVTRGRRKSGNNIRSES